MPAQPLEPPDLKGLAPFVLALPTQCTGVTTDLKARFYSPRGVGQAWFLQNFDEYTADSGPVGLSTRRDDGEFGFTTYSESFQTGHRCL